MTCDYFNYSTSVQHQLTNMKPSQSVVKTNPCGLRAVSWRRAQVFTARLGMG